MSDLPRATYRLQFRSGVGFAEAAALVPYLASLGVSHLYASPLLRAREGSTHGYDTVDFARLDPALGGLEDFARLSAALREHGLGLILDFVPNHMGIGPDNPWWQELLAQGERSPPRFDVDWRATAGATPGRVLLPVLGDPYGRVLERGELGLVPDEATGRPAAAYFEHRYPLSPATFALIDPSLPALLDATPPDAARIGTLLEAASAPERLHAILEAQPWRLAHWRTAAHLLNYRRFFDITELASVRMEDPAVFEEAHGLILELVAQGRLQGLRLDHVDGLWDPAGYLVRLQAALAHVRGTDAPFYVLVEKILGPDEELPPDWPCAGTTGYEFLGTLTGPFLDAHGLDRLTALYGEITGEGRDFATIAREAKRETLARLFPGELERLAREAHGIAQADLATRDLPLAVLRDAIAAYIVALPVYRTYVDAAGASGEDLRRIEAALEDARSSGTVEDETAFAFLRRLLVGGTEETLGFAMRLQQVSGPVMAKALEDTAFYRWHRLVALNEVGGEPAHPPLGAEAFHAANAARLARQPGGMLAGTTHDTKRGEDVRARLAVLSELPEAWAAAVRRWRELNAPLVRGEAGRRVPEPKVAYLIYQTLVGVWPLGLGPKDAAGLHHLADRLATYLQKALREAKERTRWTAPDAEYEAAVESFARALLHPGESAEFLGDLAAFVGRIAPAGAANGLAQTLLRLTAPGVPDIYQGSELWELSLVDPDNRRPVDFAALAAALADPSPLPARLARWRDGHVKQGLVQAVLRFRAERPELFAIGGYRPLQAEGARADHVLAFARAQGDAFALTIVPCRVARLLEGADLPLPPAEAWSETRLVLPPELARRPWRDRLSDALHETDSRGRLPLAPVLARFPGALLVPAA
ncbi:MAG TPA: malto-oligosyltrehalose synthase [Geminicoccaceae bacterium]|nr:malto-oligosyltrehalose synthase [Geminicoccaceae bacterium]